MNHWVHFSDLHPPPDDMVAEITTGLSKTQKTIAPKYFYDERGSALFNEICRTEEYYPTRVELSIFCRMARELASDLGPRATLLEYGCGSSDKVGLLLRAFREPNAYVGIDISKQHLLSLVWRLRDTFSDLRVWAVCADYSSPLDLPFLNSLGSSKRLTFFPGSSIGNFEPEAASRFLAGAAATVGPENGMLIGVDLKKDPARLNAAYNDAAGWTARFNLNLLERVNRDCGADFNAARFRHHAYYNEAQGRIEMHLISLQKQSVRLAQQVFEFQEGESIHTENSYKYGVEEFQKLAQRSGWRSRYVWTDPQNLFSVHYLQSGLH